MLLELTTTKHLKLTPDTRVVELFHALKIYGHPRFELFFAVRYLRENTVHVDTCSITCMSKYVGKTTLCKKLSESLDATLLRSPPGCLRDLRDKFDAYPPLIRRAFYTLGNYIAAQAIASASQSGPVVVDR